MRIEVHHSQTQQEAMRRIDNFWTEMAAQPEFPGGIRIIDPVKSWNGNKMDFNFRGRKGLLSTAISGTIEVTDKLIIFDIVLPSFLQALMPEDKVRGAIESKVRGLLT